MTKNGLDRRFPHPPPDKFRGQSMAEGVGRHFTFDAKSRAEIGHDVLNGPGTDRVARDAGSVPATERRQRSRTPNLVASRPPVSYQDLAGLFIEVYGPALATFCPVDAGGAVLQVDIPTPERAELGDANTGPEHEQDHRPYLQTPELKVRFLLPWPGQDMLDNPIQIGEYDIRWRRRKSWHHRRYPDSEPVSGQGRVMIVCGEPGAELSHGGQIILRRSHLRDLFRCPDVRGNEDRCETRYMIGTDRRYWRRFRVNPLVRLHVLDELADSLTIGFLGARGQTQIAEKDVDGRFNREW